MLAGLGVVATLAGCGASQHAAAYSGRIYSVGEVRRAFTQLGLALGPENRQSSGVVVLKLGARLPAKAPGLGSVTVVTRRGTAGTPPSPPGRVTRFANVTAFSKPSVVDEVRGALSALRWGTLSVAKSGKDRIVLGKSIGPIWLGESRKRLERMVGPGKPAGHGVVAYLGGHVLVDYDFHDALYN